MYSIKIVIFIVLFIFLISTGAFSAKWECINKAAMMCNTWRMSVPTGWIVASDNSSAGGEHGYGLVFVPDSKHEWKN